MNKMKRRGFILFLTIAAVSPLYAEKKYLADSLLQKYGVKVTGWNDQRVPGPLACLADD